MLSLPPNPTERDLRWFGGLGMLFLGGVALWLRVRFGATDGALVVAAIGCVSGFVAWAKPNWLRRIYIGWMLAVFPIGWVIGHLLLGVVYYGVLTPVGWLLRLTGHDPLDRRPDHDAATYWRERTRERKPADYFRQF